MNHSRVPCTQQKTTQTRKRRRFFSLVSFGVVSLSTCSSAFVSPANRRPPTSFLSSAVALESLTVKELRQLVKETEAERGVLSRLKRKQDLVDYLQERETEAMEPPKRPLTLPPLIPVPKKPKEEEAGADDPSSPRDAIFEKVYQRYPPVRDNPEGQDSSVAPADDLRQQYHPIFRNIKRSGDMDVIFVGTASCTPGMTRGVSCTALRLNWQRGAEIIDPTTGASQKVSNFQGGTWLFDVGECTQLNVQKSTAVRPSKITKIFLTHAHGDHTFGLPGLLCLMGQDRDRLNAPPVDIYGPQGLRMWLRVAIRYSVSRIVPPYRVHEIMNVPMAPEWDYHRRHHRFYFKGKQRMQNKWNHGLAGEDPVNWISQANNLNLEPSSMYGEIQGGRDIFPQFDHPFCSNGAPVWEIEDEGDVKVYAAPMSHSIPCLGYVVDEQSKPGRLRNELVQPIVKRNASALKAAGFAVPMKAMAVIKNLQPGSQFTFPDGTVVKQSDAVEPARRGRKVVICGDTADSRSMLKVAQDADIVVHEATNTYLQGIDKQSSLNVVTRDAVTHGHSTPQIAGNFCKAVKGKRLFLNHFSARYKGDTSVESLSIMTRIEDQAVKYSGLDETRVAAAWDMMVFPIPNER